MLTDTSLICTFLNAFKKYVLVSYSSTIVVNSQGLWLFVVLLNKKAMHGKTTV